MKKFEKVEKIGFFRANTQISNLNVLHKGLLMQDWVFRLGLQLNGNAVKVYVVRGHLYIIIILRKGVCRLF